MRDSRESPWWFDDRAGIAARAYSIGNGRIRVTWSRFISASELVDAALSVPGANSSKLTDRYPTLSAGSTSQFVYLPALRFGVRPHSMLITYRDGVAHHAAVNLRRRGLARVRAELESRLGKPCIGSADGKHWSIYRLSPLVGLERKKKGGRLYVGDLVGSRIPKRCEG